MNAGDERYPLISILIPNYNYVQYVATAVDSALAQTYPNFEVLISDNCSTDGAWELITERYGNDPRVRLNRNEQNIGMAKNFDVLMGMARGRYVMCLSSDDFLLPPHLARLEEQFAADRDLDVVYCNAYFAREDGSVYQVRSMPGEFPVSYVDARDELVENFTTVCPICFPCALFKREVLLEPGICGDPENGQTARDWEVAMLLALAGKRFAYVARPSMAIRLHSDQHTGDAYHRNGRNVLDFAAYVERYMDHPEFVRRMRGRELGVARLLHGLVAQGAVFNGGKTPFTGDQHTWFAELERRLLARGAEYEPARVRESRVSVVIEAAAAPAPLMRAIDSVRAQGFANWEVVVVDHGPIDVGALVRGHAASSKISYARFPSQLTAGAARNVGLRMARGEYVAFLDPNNQFSPDHLERSVQTIARTAAQVTVATARLVLESAQSWVGKAEILGDVAPFGGDDHDLASLAVAPAVPFDALVLYRGVFDRVGRFNDTVPVLDDWDFMLRLAREITLVPTHARTVDITARIGLAAQRLGASLGAYLGALDALYAAHPGDALVNAYRAEHREVVVRALAAANAWLAEPHGVGGFMCALAGRSAVVAQSATA